MGILNTAQTFMQRARANQSQGQAAPVNGFANMAMRAKTTAMPGNQMVPNAISPVAFTNQNNIAGMFGRTNQGTFTRTVGDGPLTQMTSQGYIPEMDPTNPDPQQDVNALMAGTDGALQGEQQLQQGYGQPQRPPMGVQMPITPTYDLNNQ